MFQAAKARSLLLGRGFCPEVGLVTGVKVSLRFQILDLSISWRMGQPRMWFMASNGFLNNGHTVVIPGPYSKVKVKYGKMLRVTG